MSVTKPIFADADHRLPDLAVQAAFHHFRNINDVIPGDDRTSRAAGQPSERTGQLRQSVPVFDKLERRKRIFLPRGGKGGQ